MSLPSYLSKIKSAGIYRFVFDKSEVPGQEAETMRLVVGYSEKGPFNTLVYVEKVTEFETIFGGINKKLERRGCFFHRLAIQALGAGPILVLNLKPFDTNPNAPEKVGAASFNVDETVENALKTLGIEDIYDTTRFWYLEPEGLGETFARVNRTEQKYITITATDSVETTNSIFVRGYNPRGYDVSFKEWYSSVLNGQDIPSYLEGHEMDKVGEYFAEVYVFHGTFNKEIATSEALAKYFDVTGETVTLKPYIENAFGEKQDTLAALAADSNSGFVSSYSGILLPNFQSANGSYISLDLLFNSDNDLHKIMMNLNVDALYDGDITVDQLNTTGWNAVGKALENGTAIGSIKLRSLSANGVTPVVSRGTFVDGEWTYTTPEPATYAEPDFYSFDIDNPQFDGYTMVAGGEIAEIGAAGDKFIVKTSDASDSDVAVLTSVEKGGTVNVKYDYVCDEASWNESYQNGGLKKYYEAYPDEDRWNINENRPCNANDKNPDGTWNDETCPHCWKGAVKAPGAQYPWFVADFDHTFKGTIELTYGEQTAQPWGEDKKFSKGFAICSIPSVFGDEYLLNPMDVDGTSTFDPAELKAVTTDDTVVTFTFDREITGVYNGELIRCNHPVLSTCQALTPTTFTGYTYGLQLPTSDMMEKLNWQNAVLNTLTKYDGIRLALTNRTDSEYHYLVDTFESFVASELKSTFGVIAKEKDNCLALVNFPAIKTFKDCKYTSFTDKNGKFQTKYIAEGYNKQKPAAVTFSLMSEFNGASFVSYNTPVILTDGTIKTYCPSAALVSNDFMAKYVNRFPYSIVAGPTYGRIIIPGLQGPDFNFSRADLDILEPMGVNCMVYVPRKGTYINSNQTAKQNPVTALSKINVRELVIFLQDEIESLLQAYQWEFNTQELRDTIKSKADTICETVKLNGGLYEFVNVCDESNNTPEVIDNEMIILDTSIEPGRGAGKMVQRLYIYKTGGLKAIMS